MIEFHAEPFRDSRGSLLRLFDSQIMEATGIDFQVVHVNVSTNLKAHTLRGMHFQQEPMPDSKLVSCLSGSAFDVIVDVRPGSPTYGRWHGVTLSAHDGVVVHVPAYCAHGFVTLEDSTSLLYLMSAPYAAELSGGLRWDDPTVAIQWPVAPTLVSASDASQPFLSRMRLDREGDGTAP